MKKRYLIVYENISSFDISMHYVMPMEILKAKENLLGIDANHMLVELAETLQQRSDTSSRNKFKKNCTKYENDGDDVMTVIVVRVILFRNFESR